MYRISQNLQKAAVIFLYSQNIHENPIRASFVPNLFLTIRFLQLALLNLVQTEFQYVLNALFQIVRLSDITYLQSLNGNGLLRISLWVVYAILFVSQVLFFILKLSISRTVESQKIWRLGKKLQENSHLQQFIMNFCDSFEFFVERILFIPTLQYLFYRNYPTTGEGTYVTLMLNNQSFNLGFQAVFLILFIACTIRSVASRLGAHSFSNLLEDKTLERNQLFSILEPVLITLLIWISGLVRESSLNVLVLDSCLVGSGCLIVAASLCWQTFAHSSSHVLLGKLATLLTAHSIIVLIIHTSANSTNTFAVIYLFLLPFSLKAYTNIHALLFEYDDKLRVARKLSWFQFIRLHRMIRTTAEKPTLEEDYTNSQLAISSFIASNSDSFETLNGSPTQNREEMKPSETVQKLLLKLFGSLSDQKRAQSSQFILDYVCYEAFYARKPVTASLNAASYIRRSTGSFRRMILKEFFEFVERYFVSHMSVKEKDQHQTKFYDGIEYDQLHAKILRDMEAIKQSYSDFYSLFVESTCVPLEDFYKKGRAYINLIHETSSNIEDLIPLFPNNIEALNLKLHLQQDILENNGPELRLLKTTIEKLHEKEFSQQKGTSCVEEIDLDHLNQKFYYVIVDIAADTGRVINCSKNLLNDFEYAGTHHSNNLAKFHLNTLLPSNMVDVHDNILRNFAYTLDNQVAWHRQWPTIYALTSGGYILPASAVVRVEIINSNIYAAAVLKYMPIPANHIMITCYGKMISYSKGFTQTQLNLPPIYHRS